MDQFLFGLLFCVIGYLLGALPFSLWVTRKIKNIDLRDSGSGHATTTNTIRQAGWGAGALVLFFDLSKGYAATFLAINYTELDWVVPLTAGLAVVGHCWPVYANFKGGMGLAVVGGSLLAVDPIKALIALAVLILLTLLIRHSARAALFTGILIGPIYYTIGERGLLFWSALSVGVVLAVRFYSDWNREYRELWLDREEKNH